MHHVFDETPEEYAKLNVHIQPTTLVSNAIYNTQVGLYRHTPTEQQDMSQYRYEYRSEILFINM